VGSTGVTDFHTPAQRWHAAGAALIGGCCRTTPQDIRDMREAFSQERLEPPARTRRAD
jgi:S-methylmethionine-dependent homocysteine/selenocysteine methylase